MPKQSKALVLDRPYTPPQLEDVVVDDPGPGEVRVRLAASGLCHTDLIWVRDAREWPVVLGHEGAGVVEMVGSGVSSVQVGDPVVISWRAACGQCRQCLRGQAHLCEAVQHTAELRVRRASGQPLHVLLNAGTFCEYAVVPAAAAIRVPPELPMERAALIGCGVATGVGAALYTAAVQPGDSVAVFGSGGVGLNVIQGARLARAANIIAVDLAEPKLLMARQFGATHTVCAAHDDPVAAVLALTGGRGADHAFDVVGLPAVADQALQTLADGGVLTLVGNAARDVTVSFHPRLLLSKQQTIRGCVYGSCRPPVDFPRLADWYLHGLLKLDELVTGTIPLEQLPAEFDKPPAPEGIRTVVRFPGRSLL